MCSCTESDRLRYISKISGPLLDRIDLHIAMTRPQYSELSEGAAEKIISSADLRKGIETACAVQQERYKNEDITSNSGLGPAMIKKYCVMTKDAEDVMKAAFSKFRLSARSYHRIIKVARTIADLSESGIIQSSHVLEALSYRLPDDYFRT
ncbi:MAG: ATP-binding protein [Firmicutes bacterium]|nr:ATP-binding protein [Bacillota bacterium]